MQNIQMIKSLHRRYINKNNPLKTAAKVHCCLLLLPLNYKEKTHVNAEKLQKH